MQHININNYNNKFEINYKIRFIIKGYVQYLELFIALLITNS